MAEQEKAAPAPRAAPKLAVGAYCWVPYRGKYVKAQIDRLVGGSVRILIGTEYVTKNRAHITVCHKDDPTPPEN